MWKQTSLALTLTCLLGCTGQAFGPRTSVTESAYFQTEIGQVKTEVTETIQNEVIVKYNAGFSTQSQRQLTGAQILDTFNTADESTQLHRLPDGTSLNSALSFYEAEPGVEFVMPNVRFEVQMQIQQQNTAEQEDTDRNIFQRIQQWWRGGERVTLAEPSPGLRPRPQTNGTVSSQNFHAGQWYLPQLQMPEVWEAYGAGQSGITVAVLDTGVDYDHPDLAGKVIKGPDYIDKDYDPKDLHGHGTHVAGVIAANLTHAEGIRGLAPNVQILAVRVLDERGSGSLFNIAKGIAYSANQGAKVINLSLGSPPGGGLMRTLANFLAAYAEGKGSLIIAAAGNSGSEIGYPAAASRFMAIGAVNEQSYLASFSNRGQELDLVAPGVNILSTYPTYAVTTNALGLPQNYATLNGTSMATPMVAAVAAMIWSQNPYMKPAEVRARLEATATDLGPIGRDNLFGEGLVNPLSALSHGN